MWKQITAGLFLLAFMTSSFYKTVIVLDYYGNTVAYAKNCENKARPKMRCNGRCQMMKKLQQEEKNDQNNTERKAANKNEVVSSKSFFITGFLFEQATSHYPAHILIQKPIDRAYFLLRPPLSA